MSLRLASLEYLGVVAARLRRDAVSSQLRTDTIDQLLEQVRDDAPLNSLMEESKSKKSKKKKKSGDRDQEKDTNTEDRVQVIHSTITFRPYLYLSN